MKLLLLLMFFSEAMFMAHTFNIESGQNTCDIVLTEEDFKDGDVEFDIEGDCEALSNQIHTRRKSENSSSTIIEKLWGREARDLETELDDLKIPLSRNMQRYSRSFWTSFFPRLFRKNRRNRPHKSVIHISDCPSCVCGSCGEIPSCPAISFSFNCADCICEECPALTACEEFESIEDIEACDALEPCTFDITECPELAECPTCHHCECKKPTVDCSGGYEDVGGFCLGVLERAVDHADAIAVCSSEGGGTLAKWKDADQFAKIAEYLSAQGLAQSVWTDAKDEENEGFWKFSDNTIVHMGTPFWAYIADSPPEQEPDGGTDENCGSLDLARGFYLSDEDCETALFPLCQILPEKDH